MSFKINKNGKTYEGGVIPKNYPASNIKMANGKSVEDALTWKRFVEDSLSSSITLNTNSFKEVMVDTGVVAGSTGAKLSFVFAKGYATKKIAGLYSSNTNFLRADVSYDGDKTFTIAFMVNGQSNSAYTSIYYR